jgi:hypothetical protein
MVDYLSLRKMSDRWNQLSRISMVMAKIGMQMQSAKKTHPIPIIWTGVQLQFNKLVYSKMVRRFSNQFF